MKKEFRNHEYLWYPPLLATVLYGIYVISTNFSAPESFSWIFLAKAIIQFYCYLFIVSFIDRFFDKKAVFEGKSRQFLVFIFGLIVSLIFGLIFYAIVKQAFIIFKGQNDQIGFYHLMINALSITVGYVLIYALYSVSNSSEKRMKSELKNAEYQKEQLQLKYELLYNKLEPHFLFNNLNTLHSLIIERNDAAESFVMSLSKVMRYSYQSQDKGVISILEEVEIFEHYMSILKERVGDSLSYEINNTFQKPKHIIPMTLSNLLENIVKHNEISKEKPLHVCLKINEDFLELSNTLNLKNEHTDHQGGLHTLSEMYRARNRAEIVYVTEEGMFNVKIPFIDP